MPSTCSDSVSREHRAQGQQPPALLFHIKNQPQHNVLLILLSSDPGRQARISLSVFPGFCYFIFSLLLIPGAPLMAVAFSFQISTALLV